MPSTLSLFELNNMVKETLQLSFQETYWICAEVSQISVASNRHCYLELIERTPKRGIIAQARAHIWRETYALLSPYFIKMTGNAISAGMKILVQVEINFHEQFGYSLNILDIDPSFSLGDMAVRRQEVIDQLRKEGIFELNKELELPRPLSRIAVISSESAAGYGDFMQQMRQSGLGFRLQLFPCSMQGRQVETDIVSALEQIAQDSQWEAVAIIRGGGSVTDLNAFDSYTLASHVAQFPLPVLTGIGHERDDSIVDLVANTRLKTPTAVAAFLIDLRRQEYDTVNSLDDALLRLPQQILQMRKERLHHLLLRYQVSQLRFLQSQREQLQALSGKLTSGALVRLSAEKIRIESLGQCAEAGSRKVLATNQNLLQVLSQRLLANDPHLMLKRGYSITTCRGRIVRSVEHLNPDDILTMSLMDGTVESRITRIQPAEANKP